MSCLAGFMPEESLLHLLENPLACHSEGARSATEESLQESLVAKRDSSVITTPSE
ncbi:hypothetical protein [Helicobacter marmotae]|uniref:hypothetical protein n=1 Tax=Helicobacter marmotae TaxID=152490 RepID=UPI001315176D|nr:hypothetical protein [Helicobacter marmotae]